MSSIRVLLTDGHQNNRIGHRLKQKMKRFD